MRSAVRRVEATPTAPPTAFFPCNLCAYLWPDICLPAAIYGGRDNSNKRAATPADWHWCAASDRFRHLGQSKTFQNLPTHQLSSLPAAPPGCCHVAAENAEFSVKTGKASASMYCSQATSGTAAPLKSWRLFVKYINFCLTGSRCSQQ